MKVAVLGGGPTGIAAARILRERGYQPHVFEAEARVGGLCRSETEQGFVHDLSGGHILHSRDRDLLARMVGWLGPEGAVACIRNTKIFYRGRWVKYPFENGLADLPVEDNFRCIKGYVEAHVGRQKGAQEPDNFRDWILWRMGQGIADCFMNPYNEKLWCSDLRDVSTSWVRGRVPEAPVDDVLRSSLGISTEGYQHQIQFYYPREGGFGTLIEHMAASVMDCVRLATPVREVAVEPGRVEVNGERFDRLINSIPIQEFYRTLRPAPPPDVAEAVRGLRFLSISTALIGVDRDRLSPYSWVYLPHPEDGPSNRITFLNNYSPGNAPAGKSSVLAEVTFGDGETPRTGPAFERELVEALDRNGILDGNEVCLTRSASYRYAYPYYDIGFAPRFARIQAHLDGLGVATLGRFGAYRYVNTDQVIMMVEDYFADHYPPLA